MACHVFCSIKKACTFWKSVKICHQNEIIFPISCINLFYDINYCQGNVFVQFEQMRFFRSARSRYKLYVLHFTKYAVSTQSFVDLDLQYTLLSVLIKGTLLFHKAVHCNSCFLIKVT